MTSRRRTILGLLVGLIGIGWLVLWFVVPKHSIPPPAQTPTTPTPTPEIVTTPASTSSVTQIGQSVEGRPIMVHTFGTGNTNVLFVGGIHGGYEWNSILLAYEMIDAFHAAPATIPESITVHIIPDLNPDGLALVTGLEGRFTLTDIPNNDMHTTGRGRFNANNVDLNRNFDCNWAPESSWRGQRVSAGTAPFSEPEAAALRDYVLTISPAAAVFWHSQANAVYASECEQGILPETLVLMNTYAAAAGYRPIASFDAYPITGDVEGWLASIGIPAVTVELEGRLTTEWDRNWAGVRAVLARYSQE